MVSDGVRRTLKALIQTVLPPDEVRSQDLHERVLAHVETSLDFMPQSGKKPFRVGFFAFEYTALLMAPKMRSFSSLNEKDRVVYVGRWAHSHFGLFHNFFKAVKGLIMLAYYEQPEVMELLGYDPQSYVDELKANDGTRRD
jgi:hypothetical protein